jgi:hypothetical protein
MQKQLLDGIVRDYSLKLCFTGKFFEYNANIDRRSDLSGHQNEKCLVELIQFNTLV